MVTTMGPYMMEPQMRSRIIRLAAAKKVHVDTMVMQLIERGLEAEDPDCSLSGGDVDLASRFYS